MTMSGSSALPINAVLSTLSISDCYLTHLLTEYGPFDKSFT